MYKTIVNKGLLSGLFQEKKEVKFLLDKSIMYTNYEHDTLCVSLYIYNSIHVYYNQYLFWLLQNHRC